MNPLLSPTSIAIIGASATEGKVGHDILKNLLTQGYGGEVYPVNPKGGEILEKTAYASITEIDGDVEMAIIVIPAKYVPTALQECVEKGVKTAVVISAGFSEVHTPEGTQLEQQLIDITHNSTSSKTTQNHIQLIGPNCLGVLRPSIGMNASFAKDLPAAGPVALVSQSGAMAVALMDMAPKLHMGFSSVLSIGNKAVLDECDYLETLENDPETKVIGMYLESIKDGRRFLEVAARVSQTKPIVLLKSGVSTHGKEAAASHTGALAGSDAAIDAACKQSGIHRAHTAEELLDLLRVLGNQPPLLSPKIAIITNAGGPGILATDASESCNLQPATFHAKTLQKLKESLPAAAGLTNPVDVIGDAGADRYSAAFEACGDDPDIDGLCVLLTPQVMTPCEEIAKALVDWNSSHPLMPVTAAFMGGDTVNTAKTILEQSGIPTFDTPERAIAALGALKKVKGNVILSSSKDDMVRRAHHDKGEVHHNIFKDKQGLLDEESTINLFKEYNLSLPNQAVATSADEAVQIANKIGYPVIAKISDPNIIHKTDIGGVRANLKSDEEVKNAYQDIAKSIQNLQPSTFNLQHESSTTNKAQTHVLIQQFLPVGSEFIIGALRDASFGPMVMVGLGGIYTELFKDTAFRIAPISTEESYHMLEELNAWKLLLGMRGKAQADIDALAEVVQKVSHMIAENPRIKELDINPILVGENQVVIADVKVILSPNHHG